MSKQSNYVSRQADARGHIHYPEKEHEVWYTLITRQMASIENRACDEFLDGLDTLNLDINRIPQLCEINQKLQKTTGWRVAPVPALIGFEQFFWLLANKQFPVATFIRRHEDLDYLQEPDIFHEIFGHCPLLTNPAFASFTEAYGRLGVSASKQERLYMARLYWFTVEFGLVNTPKGLRIYGGGILSSQQETVDSLESTVAERLPFDLLAAMRTPYRIDIIQPVYYVLNAISDLNTLRRIDLKNAIHTAASQGLLKPKFDAA